VARAAGVGVGTVSRVLGDRPLVSESTRRRVRAAIQRLGYHPSGAAQALAGGRTHTVDVLVPLLTRQFYFGVLGGVIAALAGTDYLPNIRVLERRAGRDRAFAELGRRVRPDGLLGVRVRPTPELVARLSRPIVLVDEQYPGLPSVGIDHRAAASSMVVHLLSLGHRRIALADRAADPFDGQVLRARRQGYREALAAAGIERRPEYEQPTEWSAEGGAAALDALLALPEPPTAVFAGSDTQAVGILGRARQRGLAVPDDLAVCGYGDIELARYLELTTVHVPMRTMGERGTKLLLEAIEGRGPKEGASQVTLPVELVVRSTCGAPAARPAAPGA
jgi:DNA-binding LacI/PurR family transcriptional regulator